jgi:tetratricopeptide (TPR) repeat protein
MAVESIKIGQCFLTACASAVLLACSALAQEGGDLQARILYAYQTQDLANLREIQQTLTDSIQAGTPTAALRYHLAHADYRMGLLAGEHDRLTGKERLEDCVAQLNELQTQAEVSPEVPVLQSLCYVELSKVKKLQAALLRGRAADRIDRADKLAPRNPRVLLVRALEKVRAGSPARPIPHELEECVTMFERSSATGNDAPGWGHAEAYLLMGHELRLRGDIDGARNWIEKALIAAPDFKLAQLELTLLNR